jgi:hypothetical protein
MIPSRRRFLRSSASLILAPSILRAADTSGGGGGAEPIIDIHQHTPYHGRNDDELVAHQRTMGVTTTILLPSGTPIAMPSTHFGRSIGLAADTGGNEICMALAKRYPKEFVFGANEITDLPTARTTVEK